eukprot:TRINITY_DN71981_c0_g1_i1.p2 TRINITY_DN71981_c0_g1~~TRINITY_DN71981_c0_g1_i1.p2  ORF type:complete len:245 (+),score=55.82 TRINITY_DN71981_c0_g1_i1:99-833(+)
MDGEEFVVDLPSPDADVGVFFDVLEGGVVTITKVEPGQAAYRAGVPTGVVVDSIDGRAVNSGPTLRAAVAAARQRDPPSLTFVTRPIAEVLGDDGPTDGVEFTIHGQEEERQHEMERSVPPWARGRTAEGPPRPPRRTGGPVQGGGRAVSRVDPGVTRAARIFGKPPPGDRPRPPPRRPLSPQSPQQQCAAGACRGTPSSPSRPKSAPPQRAAAAAGAAYKLAAPAELVSEMVVPSGGSPRVLR